MPATADDLDASWFDAVLRPAGFAARVARADVEPMAEGIGMLSTLLRVRLAYAEGEGPASLVVKLPTGNDHNRQVAATFDNYRREVRFYREAAARTPMRTPRAYHADVDAVNRFVLVLEDLEGWRQGDQVQGASLEESQRAVTALAQLHAAFWNGVDGGDLDWVPNSYPSVMSDGLLQGTIALYDVFNTLFASVVTEPQQRLKDRYIAAVPRLQQWLNQGPRTVIHGDFRMDNLFFGRSVGQAPLACCDWQASLRGKGVHDVAYFLSGSLSTSDRRRHERALVRDWVDALADAGVAGYPFATAWEDYRRAVLALWSYVVVIGGGVDAPDARGNRWIAAMVERSSRSLDDLGCLDLLAEFE